LGPVVAAAAAVARDLVAHCFAPLSGRQFALDVPLLDREWLDWLESAGLVRERPLLRMMLRGRAPGFQYAIAGPAFA
jgi:Acetyltransferase (GNAT) domain